MHLSYFECNDILLMLNLYKILSSEHQVDDSWAENQMSFSEILFWKYLKYVPLILPNYKSLKKTKIDIFKIFSYFKYPIKLQANCRINCRKTITCPLNITFLHKFLYRVTMTSMKSNDILCSLNVYKILRKEHQVVDRWVVDEVSVSEMLF